MLTVFDQIALSDREICGYLLGPTCEDAYDPYHQNWNISIPGNKPPVVPIPDPKVRLAKNNYCSTTCQATCIYEATLIRLDNVFHPVKEVLNTLTLICTCTVIVYILARSINFNSIIRPLRK